MAECATLPGFVDLQVNGLLGIDFSSAELTEDKVLRVCGTLARRGTAAFLATVITSPFQVYARNLPLLAQAARHPDAQGRLLGIHLEGPFLSREPGAVGAHNPAWVCDPDVGLLRRLLALAEGRVRLLTVAADAPGVEALIRVAVQENVTVSLGHHLADAAALARCEAAGATALTHLGNALPPMIPRHDNPIWCGLANDNLTAMFIADGHHLPEPVLKAMIRAKGPSRTVIVSDAAPVAGLPPGEYVCLGNRAILEPSGRLHSPATGMLAGSSVTLLECMNFLAQGNLLSVEEQVAVAFHNPLRLLGLDADMVARIPAHSRVGIDSPRGPWVIYS